MAHSTSMTAFLTIHKSFTYRGAREEWANVYHLDQLPQNASEWTALGNQVGVKEMAMFPTDVAIERYEGHAAGTPPVLVFEYDVPPAGEGGQTGTWTPSANDHPAPGDAAVWMRFGTTQKNSLGKPIYLRNYYHGVYHSGNPDAQAVSQRAALDALGAQWVTGFTPGSVTYRRAGPRGAVAQNHKSGDFITTRTLKHRGRRHRWSPSSAPTGYKWILTNVPQEIN